MNIPSEVDLILYHGGCPDGFAAAHVAKKRWPNAEDIPQYYGKPLPEVAGRHVLVLDFSWKRAQIEELHAKAASFTVIDHHVTAQKELAGLDYCYFDMARSGCGLTWDLLFQDIQRPWWVDYTEDRDLWTFKLPNSLAVNAYIMAVPYDHAHWASMIEPLDAVTALQLGNAIRLHVDHYVDRILQYVQRGSMHSATDPGKTYTVGIVNAPYMNSSDVGHVLLQRFPEIDLALMWFERNDGKAQFGMRSRTGSEVDCSAIAKALNGGGHLHAAGFELEFATAREFLDGWRHRA